MRAGLAAAEEQVAIPAQQRILVCGIEIAATCFAEHSRARIALLRWTLSPRLDQLIGRRKSAQHGIVQIEWRAEENMELTQPVDPVRHVGGVFGLQRIEGGQIGRWSCRIEVLAEDRLRQNADLQKLRAYSLDATPSAAIAPPIEVDERCVGDVEIGEEPPEMIDVPTAKGNDGDKRAVDVEAHCLCKAR